CTEALHGQGIRERERVALFLPNCPHFIIAYYAILKIGAVVVPTNPLYSEKELTFQLNDSGAETLITLDLLFPAVHKVRSQTPLKRIIVGKIQDYLPPLKKFIYPIIAQKKTDIGPIEEKNGLVFFKTLMKRKSSPVPAPKISPDDIAQLQYTGGTTGTAKGAMLSHRNLVCNNAQIRSHYHVIREAQETFIAVLPFFHS
ncbi:MAG: AMP-binding protein, partial [Deltaproteobacteria bacterium]|nr:AMP-binding protein [Deltaproteobacteria bacterium]